MAVTYVNVPVEGHSPVTGYHAAEGSENQYWQAECLCGWTGDKHYSSKVGVDEGASAAASTDRSKHEIEIGMRIAVDSETGEPV